MVPSALIWLIEAGSVAEILAPPNWTLEGGRLEYRFNEKENTSRRVSRDTEAGIEPLILLLAKRRVSKDPGASPSTMVPKASQFWTGCTTQNEANSTT